VTAEGFESLDFTAFHERTLPQRIAAGHGALAAKALARLGPLAFRLPDGNAWTYRPIPDGVALERGDAAADTVIEIDLESWEGLAHDYESAPGLLYAGRVRCARGSAMQLVLWEPALRALYQGRPVYDPDEPLLDGDGRPLDPTRSFRAGDDTDEMSHFLRTTGYLFVRDVFTAAEIDGFLQEAAELRREAVKGDRLSWWAKDASGEEVLCRVTRAAQKLRLGSLYGTERIARLVALADPTFVPRSGEGSGVTVIFKNPGVTEGLSDLPWHRDCGMGGHAVMCPVVICSLYLTPANPETGELVFLPGSWQRSCGYLDAKTDPPRAAHFSARPGDVSVHFGDVMHAAPPPRGSGLSAYRISAVTGYARAASRHHRGEKSYNDVLHQRDDGQIEHLTKVAERAS
jgi:ectoine hydroxylase-related dioxygenase (phytanoyl-CoA dioxygenase family)